MKYKFEILDNGTVVLRGEHDGTHPNQIIRRILPNIRNQITVVGVMNEMGDRWQYVIKFYVVNGKPKYTVSQKQLTENYSKYDVDLVFANAKPILGKI